MWMWVGGGPELVHKGRPQRGIKPASSRKPLSRQDGYFSYSEDTAAAAVRTGLFGEFFSAFWIPSLSQVVEMKDEWF